MDTTANHLIILSSLTLLAVYGQFGVFITSEDPTTGVTGTDVTLRCTQLQQKDAPNMTWRFNGSDLLNGDKYSIISHMNATGQYSTLIIKDAQLVDNGEYSCKGEGTSTVAVKLSLDANVAIENVKNDFLLAEGTTMACVSDNPNTKLSWSKDGETLMKGKHDLDNDHVNDLEVNEENEIVLLSADPVLAGMYTCTADLRTTEKSVSQIIAGELDIFAPKSIKVSEGEDGRMQCRVRSYPEARVTWFVNDTKIMPSEKYIIEVKPGVTEPDEIISTLMIKKVSLEDGRPTNYTCSATNGLFTKDEIIILRIRDRLAALWPFIGIVSEVIILIIIILIHEACTKGEDIGEVEDEEEDHLLQKNRSITRDGERETRMRGTNN